MKLFVSGIGTDVGKTVVSAILTEALQADYWKPVQAGTEPCTDTQTVKSLVINKTSTFHPESYIFKTPASPHAAARVENVEIQPSRFSVPDSENPNLIVEGAGGLLVPLNNDFLIIDLIQQLDIPVVLVSQNYLGNINHTLLSIEALKRRNIELAGLIFNGPEVPETENFILKNSKVFCLGKILQEKKIDREMVSAYAVKLKQQLQKLINQ